MNGGTNIATAIAKAGSLMMPQVPAPDIAAATPPPPPPPPPCNVPARLMILLTDGRVDSQQVGWLLLRMPDAAAPCAPCTAAPAVQQARDRLPSWAASLASEGRPRSLLYRLRRRVPLRCSCARPWGAAGARWRRWVWATAWTERSSWPSSTRPVRACACGWAAMVAACWRAWERTRHNAWHVSQALFCCFVTRLSRAALLHAAPASQAPGAGAVTFSTATCTSGAKRMQAGEQH